VTTTFTRRSVLGGLGAIAAAPVFGTGIHSPGDERQQQFERLWLGAAWYPEQWPRSAWGRDLDLMAEAGFNVARIGEFAWSTMEPREGQFDMDWIEQAIREAGARDIRIVLCTPTDAPPVWMTSAYPDVRRVFSDGRYAEHGGRRHFSITSKRYRRYCRRIASRLAQRFGDYPDVIGWQIGNEYTEESYEAAAREGFQQWLRNKYGSLDELNRAWTTAYWSQTYSAWSQIPFNADPGNPGWMLDAKRYITDTWLSFQRNQLEALRETISPRQFVTTNLGGLGWANRFNRGEISRELDFISWDNYVGQGHIQPNRNSASHELVRGWKRQNFWVMEMQPGSVNWAPVSNALYKGETRALAFSAVGRGADGVLFWQWRSALNGQEQYHGCVVGPDGDPLPIFSEMRRIGRDFRLVSAALRGTTPVSEVAIIHDYDSRWAIEFQRQHRDFDVVGVLLEWRAALDAMLQAVDIIEPVAPLSQYKAVFAPSLNLVSSDMAELLLDYVMSGGRLVLGPRSGMKDEFNRLWPQRQPGPLADALGARVAQFYALDEEISVTGDAGTGTARIWAEHLEPTAGDTRVLLRYGADAPWIADQPAAVERSYGKGRVACVGAILDGDLLARVLRSFVDDIDPAFGDVPPDVEVMRRRGEGRDLFVLVNHSLEPRSLELREDMRDILGGGAARNRVELEAQGVAVLETRT
jgi:beta-galactosidase